MKPLSPHINRFRILDGPMASRRDAGNNGAFLLPRPTRMDLFVIVSDQLGWEHVSVSVKGQRRVPTYEEMCYVKDLFWGEEETVMQLHPPKSVHVNLHKYVLHLWRPTDGKIPLPPTYLVGPVGKEADTLEEAVDAMRWAKNHPDQAFPDLPAGKSA